MLLANHTVQPESHLGGFHGMSFSLLERDELAKSLFCAYTSQCKGILFVLAAVTAEKDQIQICFMLIK